MIRTGALALSFVVVLLLSMQPPAQCQETSQPEEHQNTAQTGPIPSAVVVTTPSAQISQSAARQQAQNANGNLDHNWFDWYAAFGPSTWPNWILAVFAAVAAVIGLRTLGRISDQTRVAVTALRINRVSARAALQSANVAERALTELEVPYVSIGEMVPHVLLQTEGKVGPSPNAVVWFEFGFRNSGRAAAEVTSVHAELRIVGVLATPPEYSGTIEESAFSIGPNSDTGKVRWNASYKFPLGKIDDEFSSLMTSKTRLVCFGYVKYQDVFKTKWITGFGWQWNPHNNGAYLTGGRYYNYCRKDEQNADLSKAE